MFTEKVKFKVSRATQIVSLHPTECPLFQSTQWTPRRMYPPSLSIHKKRTWPKGKDICQSFNNQLSIPASLEWSPLHLCQAPVQLKHKYCLTGLEFCWGFPLLSILPFSPTLMLHKYWAIHVSHLSSKSWTARPYLRQKKEVEKQPALRKGGESRQLRHCCLAKCIYEHHWTECLPITAAITS